MKPKTTAHTAMTARRSAVQSIKSQLAEVKAPMQYIHAMVTANGKTD
jgi:hypothetical protein